MGTSEGSKDRDEVDETKVSWRLFFKMMRETSDAADELQAENVKISETKFAKSRFGKWFNAFTAKLAETKSGRLKLRIIGIGFVVLMLMSTGLIKPVVHWFDSLLFPPDYTLTAAQQAEGYLQTQSDSRSGGDEHVAYRFYEDAEYKSSIDCDLKYDFCIYAIPLYLECDQIYMRFSTSDTNDWLAKTIEKQNVYLTPPHGKVFKPGGVVTVGVTLKNPKSEYGSVDHIWCGIRGGKYTG